MPYLFGVIAILLASLFFTFKAYQSADRRADMYKSMYETEQKNEKIVEKVVTRTIEIERERPLVGARLERLCDQAGMHRAGHPDAAAETEAGDGVLASLGNEITDCLVESERLRGLQEAVRDQ